MRVFVTGATGYLGRAVVTRLQEESVQVRALVHNATGPLAAEVETVRGDLATPDAGLRRALRGMDVVIHCAAHLGEGDREQYRRVNVLGTRALLSAAVQAHVRRFVHVSTLAVYPWRQPGAVVRAEDGLDPHPELRDHYAWSKIAADSWVTEFREQGVLDTVTLRPGIIYDAGREFVARVCRRLRGSVHLILGRPAMRLPLVHVRDVAEAVWRAASHPGPLHRPLNLVGPDIPTQADYLALRATTGRDPIVPVYVPASVLQLAARRAARGARLVASRGCSLPYALWWQTQEVSYERDSARQDMDWVPTIATAAGLRGSLTPVARAEAI